MANYGIDILNEARLLADAGVFNHALRRYRAFFKEFEKGKYKDIEGSEDIYFEAFAEYATLRAEIGDVDRKLKEELEKVIGKAMDNENTSISIYSILYLAYVKVLEALGEDIDPKKLRRLFSKIIPLVVIEVRGGEGRRVRHPTLSPELMGLY